MKTPISYYGGKQGMVKYILPLIPPHRLYIEPFFGGGAIFFAKPKAEVEVINDLNNEVINFFTVVRDNFPKLKELIESTLYAREIHQKASIIYFNSSCFTPIERAWAFWVQANMSFGCQIGSSWGYGLNNADDPNRKLRNRGFSIYNKASLFTDVYRERLRCVDIENVDALHLIKQRDRAEAFFYIDPPYFNSDCGHYAGYTKEDFERLLIQLSKLKGRFLLSSYDSPLLQKYIKANGWQAKQVDKPLSVSRVKSATRKRKIEVLTYNYTIV